MDNQKVHISKQFSETIEMMRFPLIVLVVFAHMVPFETPRVHLSMDIDAVYVLISEMISHNLAKVSVRCYFLISAFFFFRTMRIWEWNAYRQQLTKKVRTLLIPYLLWNALLLLAIFIKAQLQFRLSLGQEEGWAMLQSTSWTDWFWNMPVNFPLWYMRDLMCMMLFAPGFYVFFRYTRGAGLAILALAYLLLFEFNVTGLSTTAFFFFGTGAFLAMQGTDVLALFSRVKVIAALLAALTLIGATLLNGMHWHEYILRIFIITGVITTINGFDYLRRFKRLKQALFALAPTTFFIYVVHEIYIINWLKGALLRLADSGWLRLAGYFIVPVICLLICIGLYHLFKKMAPDLFAVSLGGRMRAYVKGGQR